MTSWLVIVHVVVNNSNGVSEDRVAMLFVCDFDSYGE